MSAVPLPSPRAPIAGLILAGGRGRRAGGVDKAFLPLSGRPLLEHVIARLAPQVEGVILNANGDPARFAAYSLPVVADTLPDHLGPLAGILAGLTYAAAHLPHVTGLVSVSVDTPFLPLDLVARLQARHAASGAAVCAASGDHRHPTVALWPLAVAPSLLSYLTEGERKAGLFLRRCAALVEEWPATPDDPFFNINTLEDLATAGARVAASP